jgi:hypothetical protein
MAALLNGQTNPETPKTNLHDLSSDELMACFGDLRACDVKDTWAVTDEFIRRLPRLQTERLVACFADWKVCGTREGKENGWPISDEIARRGDPHSLLARYWTEEDVTIRDGIEHVAYHFDSPEVSAFMQKVLDERKPDGEDFYWPANYLAKKCNQAALQQLSSGNSREQGCLPFQATIQLFGKCKYRPAIPYLVDDALSDSCGNLVKAATDVLHDLYAKSPKEFPRQDDAQKYFCTRATQEGLKVTCGSE